MALRAVLVSLALITASPAWALDAYMWGVGPKVGTTFLPARYPVLLPKRVDDDGAVPKVGFDAIMGVEGLYYINKRTRVAASAVVGLGKAYTDVNMTFKYNYVGQTGALDLLFGGGAGFGTQTLRGDDPARLRIPYFPLRVEGAALIRDGARGYQMTIYGQLNVPSNHFYVDPAGVEQDVKGTPVNYISAGLELAVFFGDFTPPRRKPGPS